MATFYDHITEKQAEFITRQPMFFTATACKEGRINLSPKGMDSFRVLNKNECAYLDLSGSGNETAAHLKHDGRITLMFNSYDRNPLILRLYGHGRAVQRGQDEFESLLALFPSYAGTRQIIVIKVDSTQDSCGFAVPVMDLVETRQTLVKFSESKGEDGMVEYRQQKNKISIDGLDTGLLD
ncbi:pyridoxamine 5'-phosphate oxidase [Kordiimonas sediminis]|uniref:Pyridoxamine 5'-phosphate oxidase n=1 Tax=Kordiimonas sediminis TaxID=1735581 RepID=A0A919EAI8_9PROT|nr:pyridoxamine 5'-phosphate oxidase family protein [Kordiimonas sediminis]GHF30264.1 pyridoxamine 5'-phosphate oxidase [Kordiimonas sediminis]